MNRARQPSRDQSNAVTVHALGREMAELAREEGELKVLLAEMGEARRDLGRRLMPPLGEPWREETR